MTAGINARRKQDQKNEGSIEKERVFLILFVFGESITT